MFKFGAGVLFAKTLVDATGTAIAAASQQVVELGVLHSFSFEDNPDEKELYGADQYAVEATQGKRKAKGKAKFHTISMAAMNAVFFGRTVTNGSILVFKDQNGTTVAASVTVTPPNAGVFESDLGVQDGNGVPYTKVASAPTTGQYSVTGAGVYTFAAADVGKIVYISYRYTSTAGKTVSMTSLPMGNSMEIEFTFQRTYKGKNETFIIYRAMPGSFKVDGKQDDFDGVELDFTAMRPVNGPVYRYMTSD